MGRCNPLATVHSAVTGTVDWCVGGLGVQAGRRPWLVASLAVVLAASCALGTLIHFEYATNAEKIWPPQDSEAMEDWMYTRQTFYVDENIEDIIFVVRAPYTDILDKSVMVAIVDAYQRLVNVSLPGVTWQSGCKLVPGTDRCRAESVLVHWDYNATAIMADPDIVATVRSGTYPDGSEAGVDDVGGWRGNEGTAIMLTLVLDPVRVGQRSRRREYEAKLAEEVLSWTYPQFTAYVLTERALGDALAESMAGDMSIVAVGIVAMFAFTYSVLTRRLDVVRSRLALTAVGALAVLLGAAGALGLVSAFEVPVTDLNQVLLYVTLGIGVDDAFIITSCVDTALHEAHEEARRRRLPALTAPGQEARFAEVFGRGLRKAASSIAFTSLTDLAAFYLGSFTQIPAVRWFCLYAGTSVVFVFLMQVSLFASCLAIDVRRQAKRHVDVACCVARAPESSVVPQHTGLQLLMRKYYAPAITRNRKVHVCVLASFLALAVVCGIGVTNVKEGLPLMDLAPNGHYARQFLLTADRFWVGSQYSDVDLVFKHSDSVSNGETPESAVQLQLGMYSARDAAAANTQYVRHVSEDWWLPAFLTYVASQPALSPGLRNVTATWHGPSAVTEVQVWEPTSGVSLGDTVSSFLQQDPLLATSVTLGSTDGHSLVLLGSKCKTLFVGQSEEQQVVHGMVAVRGAVKAAAAEYGVSATVFTFFYVYSEMDKLMQPEMIQNMALALCGIAFASLVFLGSLHVTAIIVLMIALIDVALLGSLHYFGIKLNSISVINLVLATGLSVDYSAHICHRFLESNHTKAAATADVEGVTGKGSAVGGAVTAVDRAEEAVWQLGASVFNAGMSTLLAVLPLGLAQSTVFFTFFTMMTSIVVLGLAHGLVLLPVVYVLCSPPSTGPQCEGGTTGSAVTGADPAAQPGAAHGKSGGGKAPGGSSDAQIELTASTSATVPNGRDKSERFDNPLWRVGASGM